MLSSSSRLPVNSITVSLADLLGNYSPNYTVLLIGHINGTTAPVPQPGYEGPQLQLYQPYQVPSFGNLSATMSWLQQNGLNFNTGITQLVNLPTPTSVTTNPDTSVTLTWATRPSGFDSLTKTGIGTVLQNLDTDATGTYAGFGVSGYSILVTGVTGTFDTTQAITVTLQVQSSGVINANTSDEVVCMIYNALQAAAGAGTNNNAATPNIYFAMLPSSETGFGPTVGGVWDYVINRNVYYQGILIPYEILEEDDININYADFFAAINTLNNPDNIMFNKYGTIGYWTVSSVNIDSISELVMEDSEYFAGIYYPYDKYSNLVAQLPGQIGASCLSYIITNPPPYNGLNKVVINGLIPPDSQDEWLSYALSADVLAQGYTPVYINQQGQPAFTRTINGLTTYPGTEDPALQYFDIQNWQVVFYNRMAKGVILNGPKYSNNKFTPQFAKDLRADIINVDKDFERAQMVSNVAQYTPNYVVTQDAQTGVVSVSDPLQVTAGVQSITINVLLQNQYASFTNNNTNS